MRGFMSHEKTVVDLPATGVVYVTGPNGAGKSSLMEAVSMAGWGSTLRRKTPWSGSTGLLAVTTHDGVKITRTKTKSKVALEFNDQNGKLVDYESATKAQEALEGLLGEHDIWRRACVLSSQDAQSFTVATDSERKRMIEAVMCLSRFDAAHVAASKDRRAVELKYVAAEGTINVLVERVAGKEQALAKVRQRMEAVPIAGNSEKLRLELEALKERGAKLRAEQREFDTWLQEARDDSSRAKITRDAAQKEFDALIDGTCVTCGKEYTEEEIAAAKGKMERAKSDADFAIANANNRLSACSEDRRRVVAELDAWHEQCQELRQKQFDAERAEREAKTLEREHKEVAEQLEDAHDALDEARGNVRGLAQEHALLKTVESVLSLGGVRAHLLQKALAGIEQIANVWLSRVAAIDGMDLSLRLAQYSEKAGGGVKDAISLEIDGAGNGLGYKAASGGERRRIDIALMFALAEIAEASSGSAPGTLFMDEVLDSVDAEGIEAVCDVIAEMSKTRCVVVISHNPLVGTALQSVTAVHYEITKGKVRAL